MLRNMPFYIRTLMNHKKITVVMVWVIFEEISLEISLFRNNYITNGTEKVQKFFFLNPNRVQFLENGCRY